MTNSGRAQAPLALDKPMASFLVALNTQLQVPFIHKKQESWTWHLDKHPGAPMATQKPVCMDHPKGPGLTSKLLPAQQGQEEEWVAVLSELGLSTCLQFLPL